MKCMIIVHILTRQKSETTKVHVFNARIYLSLNNCTGRTLLFEEKIITAYVIWSLDILFETISYFYIVSYSLEEFLETSNNPRGKMSCHSVTTSLLMNNITLENHDYSRLRDAKAL